MVCWLSGDDAQKLLICLWILRNVARLGWGRTQVSAETKKTAWTDLWRYATSPEVGVQYPSIDKVMRFVKLVRKSIVEKVSDKNL